MTRGEAYLEQYQPFKYFYINHSLTCAPCLCLTHTFGGSVGLTGQGAPAPSVWAGGASEHRVFAGCAQGPETDGTHAPALKMHSCPVNTTNYLETRPAGTWGQACPGGLEKTPPCPCLSASVALVPIPQSAPPPEGQDSAAGQCQTSPGHRSPATVGCCDPCSFPTLLQPQRPPL